jgi:hypothetical protein
MRVRKSLHDGASESSTVNVCPARALPFLDLGSLPQHEIFEAELSFACRKWSATVAASHLHKASFGCGFYFDDLI